MTPTSSARTERYKQGHHDDVVDPVHHQREARVHDRPRQRRSHQPLPPRPEPLDAAALAAETPLAAAGETPISAVQLRPLPPRWLPLPHPKLLPWRSPAISAA